MRDFFRLWLIILIIIFTTFTANAEDELTPVRIASGGHIVHFLPLDIAHALGYFEQQGLEPKITYLKGGTATAQALISGQVDFSTNSIDHAFKSALKGKDDLRMVVLMNRTPGMVLVAHSKYKDKIKTIADLKGKKLGVTSKGSATDMVLAFLLSKNGLTQKDVTIIKAGSSTFPSALKHNEIDAGIALEPFASAMVNQGDAFVLQRLISKDETNQAFGGAYNLAGILTKQDTINTNPELVQKIVDIHIKALKYIALNDAEEIAKVLSIEVTGTDKKRFIKTLKLLKDFYSKSGLILPNGAKNVFLSMSQSGIIPTNKKLNIKNYYNNSFVAKYDENTFIKQAQENASNSESIVNDSLLFEVIISIISTIFGTMFGFLISNHFHKKSQIDSKEQYDEIKEQYDEMREEQDKLDFIESLDEFVNKALAGIKDSQYTAKLSIPTPILYSFQYEHLGDESFNYDDYKESIWWSKFADKFLKYIERPGGTSKINLTLVLLNNKQCKNYTKSLFNSEEYVEIHQKILNDFINELHDKCNLSIEYLYTIPYWSMIIDPHLDKTGQAIVCFSDPDMVTKRKERGFSNSDVANNLRGIHVTEHHAVKYFSDSFYDMQTRHYFHDVVEEIRDELTKKHNIDMTFVKKWEGKIDEIHDLEPCEVIYRKKQS